MTESIEDSIAELNRKVNPAVRKNKTIMEFLNKHDLSSEVSFQAWFVPEEIDLTYEQLGIDDDEFIISNMCGTEDSTKFFSLITSDDYSIIFGAHLFDHESEKIIFLKYDEEKGVFEEINKDEVEL